ncbi:MAG TPA: hypothetical protein ENJ93_04865 [Chloroflexi bacterium]|nr:hypothetical protein [Chloroflexota bacterium]
MANLQVQVDDRARLVTAVLAASDWPAIEQEQLPHATHNQAKLTRQFVEPFREYTAVTGINQAWLNGVELDEMFSAALRCRWPDFTPTEPLPRVLQIDSWVVSLADFATVSDIAAAFWPEHESVWDTAVAELHTIFQDDRLLQFLSQMRGRPIEQEIIIMPNLVYPALSPVLATAQNSLTLLLPPPKAVGESPPWPYSEGAGWVTAVTCRQLAAYLLADKLAELDKEQRHLLIHAVTALCLEQTLDEFEGQAYLLRTSKEQNLPELPALVEKLRAAKPEESFIEILRY